MILILILISADISVWLLSVPWLQRLGFGFYYTLDSAWVRPPNGRAYPMIKTANPSLWGMMCHSPRPGALIYGPGPPDSMNISVEVTLYPDSGSTVNTAGKGHERVLLRDPEESAPNAAVGAGGNQLRPIGTGIVDLFFPATDALTTRRIADFPGGVNDKPGGGHIKIVTSDSPAPHSSVLMLEGPLTKVASAHGPDSRLNGYPLATHGDSSGQLAPDVLYNIFTSPGHDGTSRREHRSDSAPDIRVGDYIDSDGRDRQRVISVRNGGSRGLSIDNTVLFVTTVRASDGAFASEGPAHLLLQDCANARITRDGTSTAPPAKKKRQFVPRVGMSEHTKVPPPRYATLGVTQAAAN